MRDYPRLTIEEFGRQLITTGDLDPVYVMLHRAQLEPELLARWCVAYWCYYHAGAASRIAEALDLEQYWELMWDAAHNINHTTLEDGSKVRWPRGSERRHFRGKQAVRGVNYLEQNFTDPRELIHTFRSFNTFRTLYDAAQSIPQFGPWIAFKIVDMMDRVFGHTVDLAGADLNLYSEPAKGAALAVQEWQVTELKTPVNYAITRLSQQFSDLTAPPDRKRPLSVLEIESVLCKWKSHMNGHYPLFKDTEELRHGMKGWGDLAEQLRRQLP